MRVIRPSICFLGLPLFQGADKKRVFMFRLIYIKHLITHKKSIGFEKVSIMNPGQFQVGPARGLMSLGQPGHRVVVSYSQGLQL